MRRWIGDLERRIHSELGQPSFTDRVQSVLAVGAALWTWLTSTLHLFQHPKMMRTTYRVPSRNWSALQLWQKLPQEIAIPDLSIQVELQPARKQVWMRLEGALPASGVEELAQRLQDSLARTKGRLVLDLNKLHWDRVDDLQPLRVKLAAYRSRIRLIVPKLSAAHPEIILLATMFQHYKA